MKVFDASYFDEFEEYDNFAQNEKRYNRKNKEKSSKTEGYMSAQHKRTPKNNWRTEEFKKIRNRVRIRYTDI